MAPLQQDHSDRAETRTVKTLNYANHIQQDSRFIKYEQGPKKTFVQEISCIHAEFPFIFKSSVELLSRVSQSRHNSAVNSGCGPLLTFYLSCFEALSRALTFVEHVGTNCSVMKLVLIAFCSDFVICFDFCDEK